VLGEPFVLSTPEAYVACVVSQVMTSENVRKGQQEDCRNNEIWTGDALPEQRNPPLKYGSRNCVLNLEGEIQ
jgi:hypothetical protein